MPKPTFHNLPEAKREKLLAAAIDEFAAHPFREASLDRIAAAAGVSKGSLYQYFDDKAELHRHVLETLGARREASVVAAPAGSFFDRLEATFLSGLDELRASPKLAALGARLTSDTSQPEVRAMTKAGHERAVAYFRGELAAAARRGEIRSDLDLDVGARLVATLAGPALLDVLGSKIGGDLAELAARGARIDERTLRTTLRAVMDVLRRGLGTEKAAPAKVERRRKA
jgi:AcrR family transcriptional regulator